jgi:hypothetical protein
MNVSMKQLLLSLLLMGAGYVALAQPNPEEREKKLASYRVAIFTEVLNLTPEEAQGFWPLYNDFLARREDITKQLRPSKQIDGMSDPEVEDYVKKYFELKSKELDLEKDLNQKLRKVISIRKIAKIPVAEREFRQSIVKKLNEFRQQKMERRQQRLQQRLDRGN